MSLRIHREAAIRLRCNLIARGPAEIETLCPFRAHEENVICSYFPLRSMISIL